MSSDSRPISTLWNNSTMIDYYENVPISDFIRFAEIGGLKNGCDLDQVSTYINSATSILEVGAGYGRVVALLENKFNKQDITAIERSHSFCEHMRSQHFNHVTVIEADIKKYQFEKKFDLILLMWSNISEHPKSEQAGFLGLFSDILLDDGCLVVESFDSATKPKNSTEFSEDEQTFVYMSPFGSVYGYIPTTEEINEYAEEVGLKVIKQGPYLTDTKRKRFITVMQK